MERIYPRTRTSAVFCYHSPFLASLYLYTLQFVGSFSQSLTILQTLLSYFVPILRNVPIFGTIAANQWLWTINISPAYIGQGIIMGPTITLHMLFGCPVGRGILSPSAASTGWAPGKVRDWETGSRGWITWISLAVLLADTGVSFIWFIVQPAVKHYHLSKWGLGVFMHPLQGAHEIEPNYAPLMDSGSGSSDGFHSPFGPAPRLSTNDDGSLQVPVRQRFRLRTRTIVIGLIAAIALSILTTEYAFDGLPSKVSILTATLVSIILSILAMKALGETDVNPVSGIGMPTIPQPQPLLR